MKEFTNPGDILPVIKDIKEPFKILMQQIPKKETISDIYGNDDIFSSADFEQVDAASNIAEVVASSNVNEESINGQELVKNPEETALEERRNVLKQNMIELYGAIWGQSSPALQGEVETKAGQFDCMWLLKTLKLTCAGLGNKTKAFQSSTLR